MTPHRSNRTFTDRSTRADVLGGLTPLLVLLLLAVPFLHIPPQLDVAFGLFVLCLTLTCARHGLHSTHPAIRLGTRLSLGTLALGLFASFVLMVSDTLRIAAEMPSR